MKPYYEHGGITIFCGDARELLPSMPACDVIITDPVWPNASPHLLGKDNPYKLFAEIAAFFPSLASRAVIQLGCNSDPRFLCGVPSSLPFFRSCNLDYAKPAKRGRLLYTGDIAYVFGSAPRSLPGRRLIGGRYISTRSESHGLIPMARRGEHTVTNGVHPTPRRLQHLRWLIAKFADGLVIDPCCGEATTLRAAKYQNLPAIGIEIEERYCEIAAKRLSQEVFQFEPAERGGR